MKVEEKQFITNNKEIIYETIEKKTINTLKT
jgi:hypothetical protein